MRALILAAALCAATPALALNAQDACTDAGQTFQVSMREGVRQQDVGRQYVLDAKAGKITRDEAIPKIIAANDLMFKLMESANISLRFMVDKNCFPDITNKLKAKLVENEAALKDLHDERTQFDTLRQAANK